MIGHQLPVIVSKVEHGRERVGSDWRLATRCAILAAMRRIRRPLANGVIASRRMSRGSKQRFSCEARIYVRLRE